MENDTKALRIKAVVKWVIPYFGNRHTMPYGKLEVTDGETTKVVSTKGDTLDTYPRYGCQYITFNRKPYRVVTFYEGKVEKIRLEPINN